MHVYAFRNGAWHDTRTVRWAAQTPHDTPLDLFFSSKARLSITVLDNDQVLIVYDTVQPAPSHVLSVFGTLLSIPRPQYWSTNKMIVTIATPPIGRLLLGTAPQTTNPLAFAYSSNLGFKTDAGKFVLLCRDFFGHPTGADRCCMLTACVCGICIRVRTSTQGADPVVLSPPTLDIVLLFSCCNTICCASARTLDFHLFPAFRPFSD